MSKAKENPRVTREAINSDQELASLLFEAGEALGENGLARLLTAQHKFNMPVHIMEEDRTDSFFKLKRVLREIPNYVNAAQNIGITEEQRDDTLIRLFDASPFEFDDHETTIEILSRMFRSVNSSNRKISPRAYAQLGQFIDTCSKDGIIDGGLFGVSLLVDQGVALRPAMKTVQYLADADGPLGGYTIGPFLDLLRATPRSGIPPEMLTKTLKALGGKRPYYRRYAYPYFEEALAFGCPEAGVTPTELLEAYFSPENPEKDILQFISNYFGGADNRIAEHSGPVIITDQDKEHYFVPMDGHLEHSANPYRTKRTLLQGLEDLTRLARAERWDAVSEGIFIFDPYSDTWYSLGGKSEITATSVIHNITHYDLGQLSSDPWIFVVHPKGFEWKLEPHFEENSIPDHYRRQIATFLAGTPGRGEYSYLAYTLASATRPVEAKYFIVHSAGLTQVEHPLDIEQLEQMGVDGRQLRDNALLNTDWVGLFLKNGLQPQASTIFAPLLDELNKQLPEGFSMNYYPSLDYFKPRELSDEVDSTF